MKKLSFLLVILLLAACGRVQPEPTLTGWWTVRRADFTIEITGHSLTVLDSGETAMEIMFIVTNHSESALAPSAAWADCFTLFEEGSQEALSLLPLEGKEEEAAPLALLEGKVRYPLTKEEGEITLHAKDISGASLGSAGIEYSMVG